MKKIYSIIALVAMLCTSMCMLTSCSDDEDAKPLPKLVVSAIMPDYVATNGDLSSDAVEAASKAMAAAQDSLSLCVYTSPDGVRDLMKKVIKTEVGKLDNDVKYELKKNKVRIKLWCSNKEPVIEYFFDCSELEAFAPKATASIKFAKVHDHAINNFSANTVAKLNEVVDYLNQTLAGKTIHTDLDNAYNDIGNLALNEIFHSFHGLDHLPEAENPDLKTYLCITIVFSTEKKSDNEAVLSLSIIAKNQIPGIPVIGIIE